jgi:hypothetical protein
VELCSSTVSTAAARLWTCPDKSQSGSSASSQRNALLLIIPYHAVPETRHLAGFAAAIAGLHLG